MTVSEILLIAKLVIEILKIFGVLSDEDKLAVRAGLDAARGSAA